MQERMRTPHTTWNQGQELISFNVCTLILIPWLTSVHLYLVCHCVNLLLFQTPTTSPWTQTRPTHIWASPTADVRWPHAQSRSLTRTTRPASAAGPRCCAEPAWPDAATGRWSGAAPEACPSAFATKAWAGAEEGATASSDTTPSRGAWTARTLPVPSSTTRRAPASLPPPAAGSECIWTSGGVRCLSTTFRSKWFYSIRPGPLSVSLCTQDSGWGWAPIWSSAPSKCYQFSILF